MKSLFKKISGFFVLLYIAGIGLTAYQLMELPERLSQTKVVDLLEVKQLMPVLEQASVYIGAVSLIGLLAITFLIVSRNNSVADEVRIARIVSEKQNEENQKQQEEGDKDFGVELKARASAILEQETDAIKALDRILAAVCNELEASQGAIYLSRYLEDKRLIELKASYAYSIPDSQTVSFEFGEGLAGQVAKEGKRIQINAVPEGYVQVLSGLGSSTPSHLLILPMLNDEQVFGVVEIASFHELTPAQGALLQQIFDQVADRFNEVEVLENKQIASE